jgi:hypothetical protein|tara:strand:- start:284 stop:604 length:321 start_codon:yes stop_codon:yes gene_type:complete
MSYNLNNLFPKPSYSSSGIVLDQRLTVGASVVVFSTLFNAITDLIALDVQDADVMVTFDGSDPSSTNGHRLYEGSHYTWSRASAQAARFIRQATTSASIQASEFQV